MSQWRFKDVADIATRVASSLLSSMSASPMQSRPGVVGRQFSSKVGGTSSSARKEIALNLPSYSFTTMDPVRRLYYLRERDADFEGWKNQSLRGVTVLGFDIEWRPSFVKDRPENRVATIQIASKHDVSVVQISNLGHVPQNLRDILRNPNIIKVGVSIDGDARKLLRDWQVEVVNMLDLSFIARAVDPYWEQQDAARQLIREQQQQEQREQRAREQTLAAQDQDPTASTSSFATSHLSLESSHDAGSSNKNKNRNRNSNGDGDDDDDDDDVGKPNEEKKKGWGGKKRGLISLKRLTIRYLSMQLEKSKKIQTSNWEKPLTERMLEYAANDACVAYDIYERLREIETGRRSLPTQEVP
ncbi:hypothetical protein FRC15_010532 [Serendipita sp. 397]|nr:hypothetical protein FRC15_010532 [Serendipita sp. 397]KAG8795116.1 hypothetical protein FRC16_010229 [Serendipita sp. 398]